MAFKEIIFNGKKVFQRLDTYLREVFPSCSRRFIQRGIKKGMVLINGKKVAKGYFLRGGERILLDEDYFKGGKGLKPNPEVPINIIYQDEWIIAVDKPAPIPTHALDPDEEWTLVNGLIHHFPEIADIGETLSPGIVHRLDTGASGIVLVARNSCAYEDLRAQFRRQEVEKGYIVLVSGITQDKGKISGFLGHDPSDRRRMRLFSRMDGRRYHARWSETHYEVVERFKKFTLLRVSMKTGVMHQVRAHLSSTGHPVAGDYLYGYIRDDCMVNLPEGRFFLHAYLVSFLHPGTKERMRLESPLPVELVEVLKRLSLQDRSSSSP